MKIHKPSDTNPLGTKDERPKQNNESWYYSLFNNHPKAIAICESVSDFPSNIIDCNIQFCELFDLPASTIIGHDFMELLDKGERRKMLIQTFGKTKEKNLDLMPFTFINKKKRTFTLEISTKLVNTDRGKAIMVYAAPLNSHNSSLQSGIESLLQHTNQIFFSIKKDDVLQFEYVSNSLFDITGYLHEQLLLNPFLFWNNCHPEDFEDIKRDLDNSICNKKYTIRFIRKDGQMIWLYFILVKNPNPININVDYYAIAYDITEKQKKKRFNKKKLNYDTAIIRSAQTLTTTPDTKQLRAFAQSIQNKVPGEQLSLFIENKDGENFSFNNFCSNVSTEDQTYAISNHKIWSGLKTILNQQPIIVFQSDKDALNTDADILSFFINTKIQSALIVPVKKESACIGFIAKTAFTKLQRWDRADINYISQLGQILGTSF